MAILQIRSIDDRLYKALKQRAAMDNRSVSQEVISIIQDFLSSARQKKDTSTEQFLKLCGTWDDSKSSEKIVEDIRKHRKTKTRHKEVF